MKPYMAFDLEVQQTPSELASELGLKNPKESFGYPHKFKFALGVTYNSFKEEYKMHTSAREFAEELANFDGYIVSFNGARFDLPVLLNSLNIDEYNQIQFLPHIDILRDFYIGVQARFRVSLDNIAKATINKPKSGGPEDGPMLFRQGKIPELFELVKSKVELVHEIYEFGVREGYIIYNDGILAKRLYVDWEEVTTAE